jgi:hypothetical protein
VINERARFPAVFKIFNESNAKYRFSLFSIALCSDKKSHICYPNGEKPDFVVHIPGKMDQNLVVIEVKSVTVKDHIKELRKDFDKLKMFIFEPKYYRAIMLIYGNVNCNLPQNIKQEIENIQDKKIITLWHDSPNKKPKIIGGER